MDAGKFHRRIPHSRVGRDRWLQVSACGCALPAHSPIARPRRQREPARWLDLQASHRIRFARGAEEQRRPALRPGEKRNGESFESPLLNPLLNPRGVNANPSVAVDRPTATTFRKHGKMLGVAMTQKGHQSDNCPVSHKWPNWRESLKLPGLRIFKVGGQSCPESRKRRLLGGNRGRRAAIAGAGWAACDGALGRY